MNTEIKLSDLVIHIHGRHVDAYVSATEALDDVLAAWARGESVSNEFFTATPVPRDAEVNS